MVISMAKGKVKLEENSITLNPISILQKLSNIKNHSSDIDCITFHFLFSWSKRRNWRVEVLIYANPHKPGQ